MELYSKSSFLIQYLTTFVRPQTLLYVTCCLEYAEIFRPPLADLSTPLGTLRAQEPIKQAVLRTIKESFSVNLF